MVVWSESRFIPFQNDGHIKVRIEVDEIMHLPCSVPTVQAKKLMQLWAEIKCCDIV